MIQEIFLEFYRENVCDLSLWESKLDSLKALITPWAEADILRTLDWGFTIDDFHDSYTAGPYENQHVKRGIKDFGQYAKQSFVQSSCVYGRQTQCICPRLVSEESTAG